MVEVGEAGAAVAREDGGAEGRRRVCVWFDEMGMAMVELMVGEGVEAAEAEVAVNDSSVAAGGDAEASTGALVRGALAEVELEGSDDGDANTDTRLCELIAWPVASGALGSSSCWGAVNVDVPGEATT